MHVVIDAQLILGYYCEDVLGRPPIHTAAVREVVARLGSGDTACVDDAQQIEAEYRQLVDREWFDAWFGDRLLLGEVVAVKADACRELLARLRGYGFPRGRDRRYVAVAATLAKEQGCSILLSEDLDFYDPRAKRADSRRRMAVILSQKGPVADHLRKESAVEVRCVRGHLANAA